MARRSLKPQLNQIRAWVREGRTDAWIAHQLGVTVKDIDSFKREHGLAPEGDGGGGALEEPDLRAEDEALVAAELEAEPEEEDEEDGDGDADGGDDEDRPRRRRGRRGGRRRRRRKDLDGTFDHGDEGYGLWLDPAVQDDPVYAEHWAGHRPVTVTVEPDRIVIRRAGEDGAPAPEEDDERGAEGAGLDPDRFDA